VAEKTLKILVVGDAKDAERTLKGLQGQADTFAAKMGKVGEGMATVGGKLSAGLTLPLLGAAGAAFKMASDVDESLSQVGQVFGSEADKVIAASENINDAFSQADFLAFAGNLGDITQGLGIAADESDDLTLSVLDLSQDLSSFKNVPVEQAVGAITSALAGERDSLKGLGIVIKDTDVKQRALEMGLWDGVSALSSAAQAQATMSLVTEKSANSIGDFDRTSEGAANTTKIAQANLVDLAAKIGTQLLPIGTKLLAWISGVIEKFNTLSPTALNMVVKIAAIAAAVGPLLFVGGKMISMFSSVGQAFSVLSKLFMANPWVLLIVAIVALVYIVYKNWDKITAFLQKTWDWIKKAAAATGEWFKEVFRAGLEFLKNLFLNWTGPGLIIKHWDDIKAATLAVKDWIVEKFTAVVDFFKELPGKITSATSGMWDGIKEAFREAINWLIGKWNAFKLTVGGQSVNLGPLGSITIPTITLNTPDIPKFHQGGVFRAPTPGGEGLALLKDRERVIPAGGGGGGDIIVNVATAADPWAIAASIRWAMKTAGI
jgi:hypothetical protein